MACRLRRRLRRQHQAIEEEKELARLCAWLAQVLFPTSGGALHFRGAGDSEAVATYGPWCPHLKKLHEIAQLQRGHDAKGQPAPETPLRVPKVVRPAPTRSHETVSLAIAPTTANPLKSAGPNKHAKVGYVGRLRRQHHDDHVALVKTPSNLEAGSAATVRVRPSLLRRLKSSLNCVVNSKLLHCDKESNLTDDDDLSPSAHQIPKPKKAATKLNRLLCCESCHNESLTSLQQDAAAFYSSKNIVQPEVDCALSGHALPSPVIRKGSIKHELDNSTKNLKIFGLHDDAEEHGKSNTESNTSLMISEQDIVMSGALINHQPVSPLSMSEQDSTTWPERPVSPPSPMSVPVFGATALRITNGQVSAKSSASLSLPPKVRDKQPYTDNNSPNLVYVNQACSQQVLAPLTSAETSQTALTSTASKFRLTVLIPTSPGLPKITATTPRSAGTYTPLSRFSQSPNHVPTPSTGATVQSYETAQEYFERTGTLGGLTYEKGGPREPWNFQRKEWDDFAGVWIGD